MRILFITPVSPWPAHRGGSQRSNLLGRALQEVGDVDVLLIHGGAENTAGLRERFNVAAILTAREPGQRWPFRWLHRFHPRLVNQAALALLPKRCEYEPDPLVAPFVRRLLRTGNYDLVVGRYLRPTMKSGCLEWTGPAILDLDDIDSHVYRSRLNDPRLPAWKRWIHLRHSRETEAVQREWLPRFDAVWLPNNRAEDLDYLPRTEWLPNIPFPHAILPAEPLPEPPADVPPTLLFVGSLNVAPNILAVDHFLRAIWPAIRQAEPRARFQIAGTGLSAENRACWAASPGVEPLGFVEDVATAYAGCHVAVAPIRSGSGTNIKVLECFAYGRTCVVSALAAAPFAETLRDGESLRVAGTDAGFAAACVELLRDASQRAALTARGRSVVREHFSFDAFKTIVADTVARVMEARHLAGRNVAVATHG